MSNQQPQQPGWAGPQQPHGQAPYGQQPYGQPPFPPQPPEKGPGAGKVIGLGCLGLVGVAVVLGIAAAAVGGSGSNGSGSSASKTTSTTATGDKAAAGAKDENKKAGAPKTVVFRVWGTAPAGALGGLDINYGSDSDTRKGVFRDGEFEATLPLKKGAMYYTLNAQLQGSGDINCSVTVDGQTKSAHASGGYNICDAQLSSDFTGGWQ
ncbi:MmpS family protein [Streptomyces sp. GbtcB6]|uniref:MmpS family protein n=1 Tax=Streptomyces sp. GbtcB6 TaxID=2824751 RepID=UPI0020C7129E|nr:MmpS family protein [Streptomyces sp. GbtcB6]